MSGPGGANADYDSWIDKSGGGIITSNARAAFRELPIAIAIPAWEDRPISFPFGPEGLARYGADRGGWNGSSRAETSKEWRSVLGEQ